MKGWDHARRPLAIELGEEPPLAIGEQDPARYTRRGISVRWLFGAVTTAVTSLALMGGALFAALDGRYAIEAQAAVSNAQAPRAEKGAKGDRVSVVAEEVSTRRMLEVPTVTRQGDDNVITQRPYVLVNASLVLDASEIGKVPAFNARALATREEGPAETTDAIYDRAVDGEITVSVSSFPLEGAVFDDAVDLDDTEIARQLIEDEFVDGAVVTAVGDQEGYVDDQRAVPSNVTIVPENVSELVKTSEADAAAEATSELVEVVQPGDTLRKILVGSGIQNDDTAAIRAILDRLGVARLRAGQTLRMAFQLDEEGEGATRRPSRFTIYERGGHVATVAMTDGGDFVLGEAPPGPAPTVEEREVAPARGKLPSVYRSLYRTADNHELPASVRDTLLHTFSLDVDFNAQVRAGDALTVMHSEPQGEVEPEILFASLTAGGVERRFYRFKARDGTVDFYDEDGRTGDKFLLRKPMARGVFRSGFGMRRHPILRRRRMHKGVDWAAARGTPIYAAGDGVIRQAGWKAGYGRWILIRHKNGYETGYAHQSRLARGMKPGVRVKQGQVIGYVGSTGFSTGPHLHYEVRVNGRHVNPLKIRLRRGRELSGDTLIAFKAERDRIDRLMRTEELIASR
ncbi:MAG: M23 family metallopeptidase [Pseudomonadota bacterium]